MPNVNEQLLRLIPLDLPPLTQQLRIANFLTALDDKIELNRETNRTLEALAGAIFRSWFVDFDPVVAKAAGRAPFGMDATTAALFPDRFEDSPLGPIPAGWITGSTLSFAELLSGGTPSSSQSRYWNGHIAWASARTSVNATHYFSMKPSEA